MKVLLGALLTALFALTLGVSEASAQAYYPIRVKGTYEVKFLPPGGGRVVQVSIDGQPAGNLPLTVYVKRGPHQFAFFDGKENNSMTYDVKGDTVVPSFYQAATFPLTVRTNVPGAQIALDGSPIQGNGAAATPGNHTLTIMAPGYDPLTLPFTMQSQAQTINVTLVASTFPLTVNTNVPGAQISVDGAPIRGNSAAVMPGNHSLSIMAPGYQNLSIPFTMEGKPQTINVTLVAATFPLTINTNVPGAQIAIDGVLVSGNPVGVMPGNHTLTISAPGFQNLSLPITMQSKPQTVNVTLVASTGTVRWNLNQLPRTSGPTRVSIDGNEVRGNESALLPGNHQLQIQMGNTVLETNVTISAGQTLTVTPMIQWDIR